MKRTRPYEVWTPKTWTFHGEYSTEAIAQREADQHPGAIVIHRQAKGLIVPGLERKKKAS